MSPALLCLLAALLSAQPGGAKEQQVAEREVVDSKSLEEERQLGLLDGLAKLAKAKGAAGAHFSEGANSTGMAAAAQLYSVPLAKAFAALAKLAYCGPGPVPLAPYGSAAAMMQLVPASCGEFCAKAGFKLADTVLVAKPDGGQKNAEFAYVSKIEPVKPGGRTPADCVVSFRGTWVNPANGETNKNFSLVDFSSPSCESGCKVVGGAYKIWQSLQQDIVKGLGHVGCGEGSSVAVTGHSLGGQLASIAMFFLQDALKYKVALSYTFAQPKPFNKKAAETFETLFPDRAVSYFRITNTNDQVTRYPTKNFIYQAGYQVWYRGYEDDDDYTLCGTQLDAPDCGTLSFAKSRLCKMTSDNPPELQCGGYAPYNGPHCRFVLAPVQSMCNFGGNGKTMFLTASVSTCLMGIPMPSEASGPTEKPPVFPPDALPNMSTKDLKKLAGTVAPTTSTPRPMDLHKEKVKKSKDCFRNDTSSSPLSMFGHYMQTVESIYACQKRCADTAYCEMFTYYSYEAAGGKGGGCEITGGWGDYVPGILGAVSGPKECSKKPPKLDSSQKFRLLQEYMDFISGQYDVHYALSYERRESVEPGPQGFSLASLACVGAAMLLVGASSALLAARAGAFGRALRLRPADSRRAYTTADERGLVDPEE